MGAKKKGRIRVVRAKSKSERRLCRALPAQGAYRSACPAGHLTAAWIYFFHLFLKRRCGPCQWRACLPVGLFVRLVGLVRFGEFYLDDGDVEERAAEADGKGGGGHDGRAGQEPHGHGERGHLVPARDYPWLQRHEQPCTEEGDVTRGVSTRGLTVP